MHSSPNLFVFAVESGGVNEPNPLLSTVGGTSPTEHMLMNKESIIDHLISVKTMVETMNEILGYTKNSNDFYVLERLCEVYVKLHDSIQHKELPDLLHHAKEQSQKLEVAVRDIDDVSAMVTPIDFDKVTDDVIKHIMSTIKILFEVTLVDTMDTLLSMRNYLFKKEIFKQIDFYLIHSDRTNRLIQALTRDYKEFEISDKEIEFPILRSKALALKTELNDNSVWIEQQLKVIHAISDELCPIDPLAVKFSFYDLLPSNNAEYRGAFISIHKVYRDLYEYRQFIGYAEKIIQCITSGLDDRHIPQSLYRFYGKGIILLEHIVKPMLWSQTRMYKTEIQTNLVKSVIEPFVAFMWTDPVAKTRIETALEQQNSVPNLVILKDKMQRFLVQFYRSEWNEMQPLVGSCRFGFCGDNLGSGVRRKDIRMLQIRTDVSSDAYKKIYRQQHVLKIKVIHEIPKMLYRKANDQEITPMKIESGLSLLKEYLDKFNDEYKIISTLINDCYRISTKLRLFLPDKAVSSSGIFVHVEMGYWVLDAIVALNEVLARYKRVRANADAVLRKLSPVNVTLPAVNTPCLSELDKEYDNVLTRQKDLEDIFVVADVNVASSDYIFKFFKSVNNSSSCSYDSNMWRGYFRVFYTVKPQLHGIMSLRTMLPQIEKMVIEMATVVNSIESRIPALAESVQLCVERDEIEVIGEIKLLGFEEPEMDMSPGELTELFFDQREEGRVQYNSTYTESESDIIENVKKVYQYVENFQNLPRRWNVVKSLPHDPAVSKNSGFRQLSAYSTVMDRPTEMELVAINPEAMIRQLSALRTMLDVMGDILGYSDNSTELHLLEALSGINDDEDESNDGGQETVIGCLISTARSNKEHVDLSIKDINSTIAKIRSLSEESDAIRLSVLKNRLRRRMTATIYDTLSKAMYFLSEGCDVDFRIQVLKLYDYEKSSIPDINSVLNSLTEMYGKLLTVTRRFEELHWLLRKHNEVFRKLSEAYLWVSNQLKILKGISDKLCPTDPLLSTLTFDKAEVYEEMRLKGIFMMWHRYYHELSYYKKFVYRAIEWSQAVSYGLGYENAPMGILRRFGSGAMILEHVVETHLWTAHKMLAVEAQLASLMKQLEPFIDPLQKYFNTHVSEAVVDITQPSSNVEPILKETEYRFLLTYYLREVETMHGIFGRFCEGYKNQLSNSNSVTPHGGNEAQSELKRLCDIFERNKEVFLGYEATVGRIKEGILSLVQNKEEISKVDVDGRMDGLKRYIDDFYIIYSVVFKAFIAYYRKRNEIEEPHDPLIADITGAYLKFEILYHLSPVVDFIRDILKEINEPQKRQLETYGKLAELPTRSMMESDKWFKGLDERNGYIMRYRSNVSELFAVLDVQDFEVYIMVNFYREVLSFGAYESACWKSLVHSWFKEFKPMAHKALVLNFVLPRLLKTEEEYYDIYEAIEPQLPVLVEDINKHNADIGKLKANGHVCHGYGAASSEPGQSAFGSTNDTLVGEKNIGGISTEGKGR
ncbi:hypothetical protein BaOVIS_004510 [Babesia ovis]|uniref:Dynein heavy chain n=1 Tax=Babesia ovis TaxID=5869 RepID=A0A9W5T8E7_BABOV|nr:hypothetical protein BaOVIS_004510 [Babesia ovis]